MKPGAPGQAKGFREAEDGGRARVGTMGKLLGGGMAILALGLLALGGQFPYTPDDSSEALLRLSWRLRGEESEVCRLPTAEELERLPIHMRNPDACQGRVLPYLLTVTVDGDLATQREIAPGGVRGNRPIYVLEEVLVEPGPRSVEVRFEQVSPEGSLSDAPEAPPLTLSTLVTLAPGQVGLISYDPALKALELILAPPTESTP